MADTLIINDWSEQLCDILVPHIMQNFQDLYGDAKGLNMERPLQMFQKCLSRIPELNATKLDEDYHKLLQTSGCNPNWMQKMITGIFATYAKISLRNEGLEGNIKLHRNDLGSYQSQTT